MSDTYLIFHDNTNSHLTNMHFHTKASSTFSNTKNNFLWDLANTAKYVH